MKHQQKPAQLSAQGKALDLTSLPTDLIQRMASFLCNADVLSASTTGRIMHQFLTDDRQWAPRFKARFGYQINGQERVLSRYADQTANPRVGDCVQASWVGAFNLVHNGMIVGYEGRTWWEAVIVDTRTVTVFVPSASTPATNTVVETRLPPFRRWSRASTTSAAPNASAAPTVQQQRRQEYRIHYLQWDGDAWDEWVQRPRIRWNPEIIDNTSVLRVGDIVELKCPSVTAGRSPWLAAAVGSAAKDGSGIKLIGPAVGLPDDSIHRSMIRLVRRSANDKNLSLVACMAAAAGRGIRRFISTVGPKPVAVPVASHRRLVRMPWLRISSNLNKAPAHDNDRVNDVVQAAAALDEGRVRAQDASGPIG